MRAACCVLEGEGRQLAAQPLKHKRQSGIFTFIYIERPVWKRSSLCHTLPTQIVGAGAPPIIFSDFGHAPEEEDPARAVVAVKRFLGVE
jgi:hypothetical protein